ncbi:acetylating acetaldehyde dehydrogenase [Streptomyces sp. AM 4-1-1]|uniref:acetylating acetaldehyde dehydrogenase n=1 Tax=Streptomyces sp. AM 4-1-1 TaxID=3028710 RepID=UPI0023B8AC82|nr:acetylating acetaldehyde dehydrogenase [Streptomyces sp. AM 4-1-1]WEH37000.1 acetylating acetaldehyde dehydrogenase [Streptomyces sp. AM 4-1-1]
MLNTAVLGTGLLALDLVERIQNSPHLHCGLVVGRVPDSTGLSKAAAMGCATAAGSITALANSEETFDIVFDVTNAFAHPEHAARLAGTGATVINLTPANTGTLIVPAVNGDQAAAHQHISLASCGGQTSLPVLHAITQHYPALHVEMVATAATKSVGRASRLNLDEYIETTQSAIRQFTDADTVKTMLNISPASPPPRFRSSMTLLAPGAEAEPVRTIVDSAARTMRSFVPGFHVASCTVADDTIRVAVEVTATRTNMPVHAGNLEVISAAAIHAAEQHALTRTSAVKEYVR